jgi:hypothetical protein
MLLPAFVLLFCIFTSDFSFAEDGFFCVDNIEVKQNGENSLVAKQKALSIASRKAFFKLLGGEFGISDAKSLEISESQINECLYDYSIEQEKHSERVYIAELSYRFNKKQTVQLLKKYGIDCSNVVTETENTKNVKIIVRMNDFVTNYGELKKLDYSIEQFSGEKVIFVINKDDVNNFKKIGIKYANV